MFVENLMQHCHEKNKQMILEQGSLSFVLVDCISSPSVVAPAMTSFDFYINNTNTDL